MGLEVPMAADYRLHKCRAALALTYIANMTE